MPKVTLTRSPSAISITTNSPKYNGWWADGAHVHVMQGGYLYWADGTTTDVEDTSPVDRPGSFSTMLWGTSYHGLVDTNGQVIHWNDGSEWIRLEKSESSLDGSWRVESEARPQRHSIAGTTLYLADGTTAEISESSPGVFTTTRSSQSSYGRLELCGQRLKWSDGESWTRLVQKGFGTSARRTRLTLLWLSLAVLLNFLFVTGMSLVLHRDWKKYPQQPKHPSRMWPDAQVWQFAAGFAGIPLLLVHGTWALVRAIAVEPTHLQSLELEAARTGKPAMLWLLEPMRLVALIHIIFYHEEPTKFIGRWGFVWITFFMVLAGFVGTYQILTHDPDASRTTVAGHMWKRVKRLWPLYLIYIFVVSVPHYFEDSLAVGTIVPTREGAMAAARKLCSWMGLFHILGLQTLIPLDPHFNFVARTCWFVPTLLICETFLPFWLRGLHTLLDRAARRVARVQQLQGKVEPSRVLVYAVGLCCVAGAVTAFNCTCMAGGKVFLRQRAFPDSELSDAIFWFMRFSPLGHWSQVLLGAVLARTFIMMQSRGEEESEDTDSQGCCPEEVVPLSPQTRSIAMMMLRSKKTDEGGTSLLLCLRQAVNLWPWFLGAACSASIACLASHLGTDHETNASVLFLNCGAPAVSFAALIVCLAQASLQLEPHRQLGKFAQVLGAVCFPAYLFVAMSEQVVWHYLALVFDPDFSVTLARWLRIPFLMLVQHCWEVLSAMACPKSK